MFFGGYKKNNCVSNTMIFDDTKKILEKIIEDRRLQQGNIVIVCGSVTENYDSLLKAWAYELARYGFLSTSDIQKTELLTYLSSQENIRNKINVLLSDVANGKKLYMINGLHRMDYSEEKTSILLDELFRAYQKKRLVNPIVLNVPKCVCEKIKRKYSYLEHTALWFYKESFEKQNGGNTEFFVPKMPEVKSVEINPIETKPIETKPWYTTEFDLLKREKDGMAELLNTRASGLELATVQGSKRLYWKFYLKYGQFHLHIKLLYGEKFSKNNPSVGVIIDGCDIRLDQIIRSSYQCKRVLTNDKEFPVIYIMEGVYKNHNESVAAAALQGLISILDKIK